MTIPRQARDRADRRRRLPWTCDPALRWEDGQAGACLAAIGILRELLGGDLDPAYWRVRIEHALEALDAAVGE
jgi:hypothetical protein